MKKIYITPFQKVVEMNMSDNILLSGSDPTTLNDSGTDAEALVKEEDIFGKKGSLWNEDW